MSATFTNYSAAITSYKTTSGQELILKFDNLENYHHPNNPGYGASIGRVANRIYGAKFDIQGKTYQVDVNQQPDVCLHGGPKGWSKINWEGPIVSEKDEKKSTTFTITSDHLDQGFPGKVVGKVVYTQYSKDEDSVKKSYLDIEYEVELTEDSPVSETIVSVTNHNYFNISDNVESLVGTKLKVFSNKVIERNKITDVPTGNIYDYATVTDDLSFITFDDKFPVLDHGFMVQASTTDEPILDTRSRDSSPLVHLYHPSTKANVKIYSTEPVFQIYTGDGIDLPKLPGEPNAFPPRCGIAVEPARPTNAQAFDKWRPWVALKKGQKWGSSTTYVSWVGELVEY